MKHLSAEKINRRTLLKAATSASVLSAVGCSHVSAIFSSQPKAQTLSIQHAEFALRTQATRKLVSLSPNEPPPVLSMKQGVRGAFNVVNTLDDYTAMHWHGIRLPNRMDGVPYLTQAPIAQDESYLYDFTPPDAGTYWYHPHCMTMTQMASGLTGALIVHEKNDPGFDGDQVINLRDFKLDTEDQLKTPYSLRGAARGGTHGNHMTANWLSAPEYAHPSGGLVRLRVLNTDTTRIYKVYLSTQQGRVIAWDGHPVDEAIPMPSEQTPMLLGPGQRADIVVRMPEQEGKSLSLYAQKSGQAKLMASLRAQGPNLAHTLEDVNVLPKNPLAQPDLENVQKHEFVFGWSPDGSTPNNGFCGSFGKNFWSINRVRWPGDAEPGNGPLATLEYGESYILRFRNESPNLHPIHLHGLVFKPLRSNKRTLPKNWTDTVLLLKNEVIDVVLVADNIGDWAFHCHVIEHQKTGLAGFIRVV